MTQNSLTHQSPLSLGGDSDRLYSVQSVHGSLSSTLCQPHDSQMDSHELNWSTTTRHSHSKSASNLSKRQSVSKLTKKKRKKRNSKISKRSKHCRKSLRKFRKQQSAPIMPPSLSVSDNEDLGGDGLDDDENGLMHNDLMNA